MEPREDSIGGISSSALFGVTLEYRYSTGRRYRLSFDTDHHVRFDDLSVVDGPQTPVLGCRVLELRDGQYLVHWIVKAAAIHVSLVVDLAESRIDVSAMMPPNRWEFFDSGEITSVRRSGD